MARDKTREEVREEWGEPIAQKSYTPHRRCRSITEFNELYDFEKEKIAQGTLASCFETYRYKGMLYNHGAAQASGMIIGMTLGLGELWAFPMSIEYAKESAKEVHEFTVWYDEDDRCLFYRKVRVVPETAEPYRTHYRVSR